MNVTAYPDPPSIAQCLELMEEHGMLHHIRAHSSVVARVAEAIWEKLRTIHPPSKLPDKNVLIAGGLLHDIAKSPCLQSGCDHAKVGAEICLAHGLFQVSAIVREHVYLQEFDAKRYQSGVFYPKELIFYSDKRVVHDTVVSLQDRLQYILERYGQENPTRQEMIRKNFNLCQQLEQWLCHAAGCTPEHLIMDMQHLPFTAGQ